MTIDAKRYEELCEKRVDLDARITVHRATGHFALENAERCKRERNYVEWSAWLAVIEAETAKLKDLSAAYDALIEEHKALL